MHNFFLDQLTVVLQRSKLPDVTSAPISIPVMFSTVKIYCVDYQVTKFLSECISPAAPELVTVDILTIFSHMARRLPESNDKILLLLMPSQHGE